MSNDEQLCIAAGFTIRDGNAYLPAPWGTAPRWKREAHGLDVDTVATRILEEGAAEAERERLDASLP